MAASKLYKKNIRIYDTDLKLWKTFLEESERNQETFRFLYDGFHYDCIFLSNNGNKSMNSIFPNSVKQCQCKICGKYDHCFNFCSYKCLICGKSGHLEENCFNEKKCYNCGKVGHISAQCYKRNFRYPGKYKDSRRISSRILKLKQVKYVPRKIAEKGEPRKVCA